MYIEIHKNSAYAQPYWFTIKRNGNHKVIARASEMYTKKYDCEYAANLLKIYLTSAPINDLTGEA